HTMAAWTLKKRCGGEIYLNSADKSSLIEVIFGLAARFFPEIHPISPDEVDRTLAHGDQLQFGAIHIEILSTPGHTPGHVSFYLRDQGKDFSGSRTKLSSIPAMVPARRLAGKRCTTRFFRGNQDEHLHHNNARLLPE